METDLNKVWELIEEKAITIEAWPQDHRTIDLDDLEEILKGKFVGSLLSSRDSCLAKLQSEIKFDLNNIPLAVEGDYISNEKGFIVLIRDRKAHVLMDLDEIIGEKK